MARVFPASKCCYSHLKNIVLFLVASGQQIKEVELSSNFYWLLMHIQELFSASMVWYGEGHTQISLNFHKQSNSGHFLYFSLN